MPPARPLQGLSIIAPVQPQPAHLLLQAPAVCQLLYGLLGPWLMVMAWTRTWETYTTVQTVYSTHYLYAQYPIGDLEHKNTIKHSSPQQPVQIAITGNCAPLCAAKASKLHTRPAHPSLHTCTAVGLRLPTCRAPCHSQAAQTHHSVPCAAPAAAAAGVAAGTAVAAAVGGWPPGRGSGPAVAAAAAWWTLGVWMLMLAAVLAA